MNDNQKTIINSVPAEYRDRLTSEANIRWALNGGAISGYLSQVARSINAAIEHGAEPSFPSIAWNNQVIADRKTRGL